VAAARALAPAVSAAADAVERDRQLPPELVAAIAAAGLFRLLVPASLGGAEIDLLSFSRVVEVVAQADASVAWCVAQAAGLGSYAAYLDEVVASAVFGSDPGIILANGPGADGRPGRACETPGGYRVTGRWAFASGCRHASWLLAVCQLHDEGGRPRVGTDGRPLLRTMLVPAGAARIDDTWHVSGLRGTGSHEFALSDELVPAERAIAYTADGRRQPGPLYQFPLSGMFGPGFASVAIGVARATLSSFAELVCDKTPYATSRRLRDSPVVQSSLARAEARLRGATALLHKTLSDVWDEVVATGELTLRRRADVRLASTHAIHEAADVVDVLYEAAGSTAIVVGRPFERRFRDVHAVTQQVQGRAAHFEAVGRVLLGLDPDSPYV